MRRCWWREFTEATRSRRRLMRRAPRRWGDSSTMAGRWNDVERTYEEKWNSFNCSFSFVGHLHYYHHLGVSVWQTPRMSQHITTQHTQHNTTYTTRQCFIGINLNDDVASETSFLSGGSVLRRRLRIPETAASVSDFNRFNCDTFYRKEKNRPEYRKSNNARREMRLPLVCVGFVPELRTWRASESGGNDVTKKLLPGAAFRHPRK